MVAGCENRSASLYRVDGEGLVTQHNDLGFLAIGSGGIHSAAYFMQLPYSHGAFYSKALLITYLSKKRAEIAPGVGPITDMFLITDGGIQGIAPETMGWLERAHTDLRRNSERAMIRAERNIIASSGKAALRQATNNPSQEG